jgi:ADP-ribose pyrophosphatase YjhB (NUDIX family)/predicted transcriptional regulator
MKEIHEIKIHILKTLLFSSSKKFSELKPKDMESAQFMFHLKDLMLEGLVIKNDKNCYELTELGKSFANKYDYDSTNPNTQAKHSVVICAFNNQNEILLYTRLKNPFYGCQGFMTGKVQYGEKIIDTAKREFVEETGLVGNPKIKAIRHFKVYDKTSKKLLEDKVMYIHTIENPVGKLNSNNEGDFYWVKLSEILKVINNPLEEFEEIFNIVIEKDKEWFKEIDQFTSKF